MEDRKEYLNTAETAELLGLTEETVRAWHHSPDCPLRGAQFFPGGRVLFKRTHIDEVLESALYKEEREKAMKELDINDG